MPKIKKMTKDDYKIYLLSEHWKNKRQEAKKKKRYRCFCCHINGKETILNLHHNNYSRLFNEKMKDLVWLCVECHKLVHKKKVGKIQLKRRHKVIKNKIDHCERWRKQTGIWKNQPSNKLNGYSSI